jgi:hypothetical protein
MIDLYRLKFGQDEQKAVLTKCRCLVETKKHDQTVTESENTPLRWSINFLAKAGAVEREL